MVSSVGESRSPNTPSLDKLNLKFDALLPLLYIGQKLTMWLTNNSVQIKICSLHPIAYLSVENVKCFL